MNLFNTELKKFKNITGIYKITCTANNKIYIGSSVNIGSRLTRHRSDLKLNNHHSILLQRAFNKYNEDAFEIDVIEVLERQELLLEREQYYLDELQAYDTRFGFNIAKEAGSRLGIPVTQETKDKISQTLTGYKHSDETKEKISTSHKGKSISNEHLSAMQQGRAKYFKENGHPLLGKGKSEKTISKWKESVKDYKVSDETKLKMSLKQKGDNNPSAKLTESKVLEILELSRTKTHTVQEIATIFEVSKGTIENILYGRTWKHVPR